MFEKNSTFSHDLKFGEMKEDELADILVNQEIEVKTDCKWKETRNLAIEFRSRGKLSGISTSKAQYWAFILDVNKFTEGILIVPIAKVIILARKYYKLGSVVNGGENSDMVLVPIEEFVK